MSSTSSGGEGNAVADDDLLPIRALNDVLFCERRCVMHLRDKVWVENRYTLEGTAAHGKVHGEPSDEELGGGGRLTRHLWLRSDRLKLIGVADVVEFRGLPERSPDSPSDKGDALAIPANRLPPFRSAERGGGAVPYPIEYKHGPRRRWDNDDVQVCAQALCLEEMFGVAVPTGAVYHVKSRRRREIPIDARLRVLTEQAATRLRELLAGDATPPPINRPRCRGCSLCELCLPEVIGQRDRYAEYVRQLYQPATDPSATT